MKATGPCRSLGGPGFLMLAAQCRRDPEGSAPSGRGDLPKATGLPCSHCLVRRYQARSSDPLIREVELQVCSEVCRECLGAPGHYTCHVLVKGRSVGICPKRASGSQWYP